MSGKFVTWTVAREALAESAFKGIFSPKGIELLATGVIQPPLLNYKTSQELLDYDLFKGMCNEQGPLLTMNKEHKVIVFLPEQLLTSDLRVLCPKKVMGGLFPEGEQWGTAPLPTDRKIKPGVLCYLLLSHALTVYDFESLTDAVRDN